MRRELLIAAVLSPALFACAGQSEPAVDPGGMSWFLESVSLRGGAIAGES